MRGAWRWVILLVAMCSVGIAALREQRSNSETAVPTTTADEIVTSTSADLLPVDPIPGWCERLLAIDETTPLSDVAKIYLEVGLTAGGVVERDLTAAAIVLAGNSATTEEFAATTTTIAADEFDAEGRVVEDDAVLRAGQLIDEMCKRVSLQASPAETVPQ